MSTVTKEQFIEAIKVINDYKLQLEKELASAKQILKANSIFEKVTKNTPLLDVTFSTLLKNSLTEYFRKNGYVITWQTPLSILEMISTQKICLQRNFGEARLLELEEVCMCAGIKMLP